MHHHRLFLSSRTVYSIHLHVTCFSTTWSKSRPFSSLTLQNEAVLKRSLQNLRYRLKREDVVVYKAPESTNKFSWAFHGVAVVQFIFWTNIADLYWRLSLKNEREPEKFEKRLLYSGGMLLAGLVASASLILIPSRTITYIKVLKGGVRAEFETGRKLLPNKKRIVPVKNLYLRQRLYTRQGETGYDKKMSFAKPLLLREEGKRMPYFLDRSGEFYEPKAFDAIFWTKENRK
ncbi:3874_t:CDS:2 [Paraglomus occultum]|uniref:3874_t:CDS:1 n=1 Tax=Paraglomus occultum TaxID=144539 RepID=A0A9N8VQ66_9GLOM|nr:3874_t:CDS:2 [Paraglomus occultum]